MQSGAVVVGAVYYPPTYLSALALLKQQQQDAGWVLRASFPRLVALSSGGFIFALKPHQPTDLTQIGQLPQADDPRRALCCSVSLDQQAWPRHLDWLPARHSLMLATVGIACHCQ